MSKRRTAIWCCIVFLVLSAGCESHRRDKIRRRAEELVKELYGLTYVSVMKTAPPAKPRVVFFIAEFSTGPLDFEAQRPLRALVMLGKDALPYVFAAMLDDRVIPKDKLVGYIEGDSLACDIRVSDKAAAVFSTITWQNYDFLRSDASGKIVRVSPEERIALLQKAYMEVLDVLDLR